MTMGWMTSGGWADLLAPVLRDFMEVLDQGGHDGRGRYVDQILHVTKGLLVVEIQPEFVLHLPHRLVRFQGDVRNARVALNHHKKKIISHLQQVGNEIININI